MPPDHVPSADADRLSSSKSRNQLAEWMIDNVAALITYVDQDLRVVFANATFESWLGIKPSQMVGKHLSECIGERMFAERHGFLLRTLAGEQITFDMPVPVGGVVRNLQATYLPDISSRRVVSGIFIMISDVSEIRGAEREASRLARTDVLTQLPNRLRFNEDLQKVLTGARTFHRNTALLFLDIDHFKSINDTYGHSAGDAVLVEIARRLRSCVQEPHALARIAGDEFVILLEIKGDMEKAVGFAGMICVLLEAPILAGGDLLRVTASIGITSVGTDEALADSALIRADKALYKAKRIKGNTYAVLDLDDPFPLNRVIHEVQ